MEMPPVCTLLDALLNTVAAAAAAAAAAAVTATAVSTAAFGVFSG